MTDVDEVVGTETADVDEVEAVVVQAPNRFDKIKESYKGVTTALDLSEETAAYEDFQSLLTEQKVRYQSPSVQLNGIAAAAHALYVSVAGPPSVLLSHVDGPAQHPVVTPSLMSSTFTVCVSF